MGEAAVEEGRQAVNARDDVCPVAYDHNDDLDECAVCGWVAEEEGLPPTGPKDMTDMTGPQRISEAIRRLNGAYAPTRPILFAKEGRKP